MSKNSRKKTNKRNQAEGVIFVARRGIGYVTDKNFKSDIEIQNQHMGTALSGDTVRVEILGKKRAGF
ncbi:MAG: hypothetical protein IID57_11645 [Proteobacteria bacterium]|nr:hypothetical protein [Pseudomonadota bacterium]